MYVIESPHPDNKPCTTSTAPSLPNETPSSVVGNVTLVGAGPGDPELLTVKAVNALKQADVILHDQLVTKQILQLAQPGTHIIEVGKSYDNPSATQHGINHMLVSMAQRGLNICRLKGGDPMVFGRGGEEALYLSQHHVSVSIIPGITAALGCCAYSGIPLTHRGISRGFTVVTARGENDDYRIDWTVLVNLQHTLVFYMGLHRASWIASNLMLYGMNNRTPVAIISNGTHPNHQQYVTTLSQLDEYLTLHTPPMPSLIVVGETVSISENLSMINELDQSSAATSLYNEQLEGMC
ncbi:uroporphyrinogen-III C-methyltransferase [Photobacterium frigidiphilum]|uniref:uroporphyrinogen-III C-methyltransferase n=1 Tax=Photobacterium frigidiphilum TaxID=264736 RepID=UPI001D130AE9|nr:uroporphyrinogen-III C-methyltransferase [Photobacterium frigidiphilum]